MPDPRYFLPDHPTLQDVYSKNELRALLQKGVLRRADIAVDDETGLAHLLGDLLTKQRPTNSRPDAANEPVTTPIPVSKEHEIAAPTNYTEFRADTPLPGATHDDDEADYEEESHAEPQADDPGISEDILLHLHPSWLSYTKSMLFVLVCGAVAYLCQRLHLDFLYAVIAVSIAVLTLLHVSLLRSTTDYYITTERVEAEFGIVGRNSREVRICDIRAIDVRMGGVTALIGIGTVDFCPVSGASVDVQFKNIPSPHRVKHIVRELQG